LDYNFPIIANYDAIKFALEGPGSDDFVEVVKGSYKVINYIKISSDTFRPINVEGIGHEERQRRIIRREFRGLIFDDKSGDLIRRPYSKFFNLNEREETLKETIDFNQPHDILQKLDGSMVAPFITSDGVLRFGTKMGETDISQQALDYCKKNDKDLDFIRWVIEELGSTPIFEWCSRANRVVIDYPQPRFVLTACRDIVSGTYWSFDEMHATFGMQNFEIVGHFKV
jgi:RNA ligase